MPKRKLSEASEASEASNAEDNGMAHQAEGTDRHCEKPDKAVWQFCKRLVASTCSGKTWDPEVTAQLVVSIANELNLSRKRCYKLIRSACPSRVTTDFLDELQAHWSPGLKLEHILALAEVATQGSSNLQDFMCELVENHTLGNIMADPDILQQVVAVGEERFSDDERREYALKLAACVDSKAESARVLEAFFASLTAETQVELVEEWLGSPALADQLGEIEEFWANTSVQRGFVDESAWHQQEDSDADEHGNLLGFVVDGLEEDWGGGDSDGVELSDMESVDPAPRRGAVRRRAALPAAHRRAHTSTGGRRRLVKNGDAKKATNKRK